MRILITGVNGFIGSSLYEMLQAEYQVVGVGRKENKALSSYYRWDISEWNDSVVDEIGQIDIIIHAAASLSTKDDDDTLVNTNCLGTYNIYKLAKNMTVSPQKIFYISGAPVIGMPIKHPITEEHPLNPMLMYHATKLSGEYILNQLCKCGVEVINLRVQAPVGRNMPIKSILPIFIYNAIHGRDIVLNGAGTRKQTYLDVRDLCMVIKKNLTRKAITGTYMLAGEQCVSNIELAKLCKKEANSKSRIIFSGVSDDADNVMWDFDCFKAKTFLDYRSQFTLKDTVTWIMDKYR